MATDPVPGGYLDNQYLHEAIRALKQCKVLVAQMVDQRPGPQALMSLLLAVVVEVMRALDALREMQRIREKRHEWEEGVPAL